jgi:hypothetical protein
MRYSISVHSMIPPANMKHEAATDQPAVSPAQTKPAEPGRKITVIVLGRVPVNHSRNA